jgi:hypothetical protein
MPEAEEIRDKNIREGKFEHEQFELPNINREEIKDSESLKVTLK